MMKYGATLYSRHTGTGTNQRKQFNLLNMIKLDWNQDHTSRQTLKSIS